jgi:hypothetical protein
MLQLQQPSSAQLAVGPVQPAEQPDHHMIQIYGPHAAALCYLMVCPGRCDSVLRLLQIAHEQQQLLEVAPPLHLTAHV